jgi:hypothetical protein
MQGIFRIAKRVREKEKKRKRKEKEKKGEVSHHKFLYNIINEPYVRGCTIA